MSGTKAGGLKAAATNNKRNGDDFYARIGAKGGHNGHTGGFAANRELARVAGAKGGSISRRGEAKEWYGEHREQIIRMKAKGMNTYQIAKAISGGHPQRAYYVMSKYGGKE